MTHVTRQRDARTAVWAVVALCVLAHTACPSAVQADDKGLLSSAEANRVWWNPQGTNVMIFQADRGGEPIMIVDKAALASGAVTFDIRSDAQQYGLQSGGTRIDLTASGDRDALSIDASRKSPGLKLNERELTLHQRNWESIVKDPTRTAVALTFAKATRVAVTVKNADGDAFTVNPEEAAAKPSVPDGPTPQPRPATITPKTETDKMLLEAQKSVFRLRVKTRSRGVNALGTGFFISEDGYAITSFQVVKGAEKAWALLDDFREPVSVELTDVRPDLNLALIRVRIETLPVGTTINHLPMVEKDPTRGNETWTLGYSSYGQPIVTAGAVYDVLPYTKLPPEARSALSYNHLAHWVITTAPITVNNSGGPMVNTKGQLVGVTTWVWPQQQQQASSRSRSGFSRTRSSSSKSVTQTYYSLHAQHVTDLLASKPPYPLTFAQAQVQFGMARTPHNALPRVEVELFGTAQQLQRAANSFHDASICPLCKGETEIVDIAATNKKKAELAAKKREEAARQQQQQGAQDRFLRGIQRNQDEEEEDPTTYKPCPRCKGTGFERGESVFRLGSNMVLALAGLDRSDARVQPTIAHMQLKLLETVERNPQRLVRSLNVETMRYLHHASMPVGTPVLLVGMIDESPTPGDPNQLTLVEVGEVGPTVLIAEPDIASPRLDQFVLVGGILAGYLDDDQGKPIPVIQRGFIFNVPKEEEQPTNGQQGKDGKPQEQSRQEAWRRWMESRGGRGGSGGRGGPPRGFRR